MEKPVQVVDLRRLVKHTRTSRIYVNLYRDALPGLHNFEKVAIQHSDSERTNRPEYIAVPIDIIYEV